MRIRTIKPEFFLHERLFEAERETNLPCRLAFAGLWCAADREGRFKWEPRRLGIQILPYDGLDFSRVLDALTARGFVMKYTSGSCLFGWIPGFVRHQVVNNKERPSELPVPDGFLPESATDEELSACATRELRDYDAMQDTLFPDQAEGKGREGKGTIPAKRKPRASPPSEADPRHHAITSQIGELYRAAMDESPSFNGQCWKALAIQLKTWDGTADAWLDRYWEVLTLGKEPFAPLCRKAADPQFLCRNWQSVASEVQKLHADSERASANARPRSGFTKTI